MTTDSQSPSESPGGRSAPANGRGSLPQSIGKYRIQRKLGEGGMGTVYLALDTQLKRLVALKVLRSERADNPTLVKRFHAEAKTASALKHPNIVAVYEAGQADGHTFIAMEFIDGIDVHDLVQRREVIPIRRSIDIVKQVAGALQHAYERGVVHRDIKPSNLLIQRDGTVKLADLGLARLVDEASEAGITRDGTTVGTVDYMSPEQARSSRKADTRSDIYSLGCAWYHMLTGEPPYADGSLTERLRLHAEGRPPDPREINPKVPEGVVAILNRMMARNPEERYRTPADVIAELDKVNLQRNVVVGEILSEMDAESSAQKPAAKTRKIASPMPARDPKLVSRDSDGAIVFPVRLVGTLVAVIALLALAAYGWSLWGSGSQNEPVNVDFTADPLDVSDPFDVNAIPDNNPPDPPADAKPADDAADDNSAANTADTGDPVARVETDKEPPPDPDVAQKPYLPDWADRSRLDTERNGLAVVKVALPAKIGPNARPPTVTLKSYLDKLPAAGGVLELPAGGPFELNLAELADRERIVIKAADPTHPAVYIRQHPGRPVGLNVAAKLLEFDGLDLFFQLAGDAPAEQAVMLRIVDGDLLLRNCSVQVVGDSPAPVVAFNLVRSAPSASTPAARLPLARTVVLGPNLTAARVEVANADLVVRDSLLVAGRAAAIQLVAPMEFPAAAQRTLRLVGDTIVSSAAAVELTNAPSASEVVPTHVAAVDSILANADPDDPAAMLVLQNWPRVDGPPDKLIWESAGSAYQGWPRLVLQRDGDSVETVAADFTDWQPLWQTPGEETQFHPAVWPSSLANVLAPRDLKPLAPDTLPNAKAHSLAGVRPGCALAALHLGVHSPTIEQRDIPPRPPFPAGIGKEFENAETIPVDLTKQDLGRFLAQANLPPRAVILAEGFGLRRITPFTISDRTIRIEFRQTDGKAPLRLTAAAKGRSSDDETTVDALMTVDNGRLEIVGGHFELSVVPNRPVLPWFLDAHNGGFSIERCEITSLPGDASQTPGLVRWRHDAKSDVPQGTQVGIIRDSFLVAGGTLIDAQIRQQQLFIDNSTLASPGTLFALDVAGALRDSAGSVVLQQSTLSAATTFFDVTNPTPHDSRRATLGVFAERTIFGAPLNTGAAAAPVLFRDRSGSASRQLAWVGNHNGFSDAIKSFVVTDAAPSADAASFDSGWLDVWGADQIREPLHKPGGVLFTAPLPALEQLRPENFALHRSAEANAWGGRRIGADPAKIASLLNQQPNSASRKKRSSKTGF